MIPGMYMNKHDTYLVRDINEYVHLAVDRILHYFPSAKKRDSHTLPGRPSRGSHLLCHRPTDADKLGQEVFLALGTEHAHSPPSNVERRRRYQASAAGCRCSPPADAYRGAHKRP